MIRTLPPCKLSKDPSNSRAQTLPERAAAAQKKSLSKRDCPPVKLKPMPWEKGESDDV